MNIKFRFLVAGLLVYCLFHCNVVQAQINYSEDFEDSLDSWESDDGFVVWQELGCNSTNILSGSIFNIAGSYDIDVATSPLIGVSNGNTATFSFDYKILNLPDNNDYWGDVIIEYASSLDGSWMVVETISSYNHIDTEECISKTVTFVPQPGDVYLKITCTPNINSTDIINASFGIDNITITQDSSLDDYTLVEPSITADIGTDITIHAKCFEPGLTPGPGMGEGLEAWIGINYENTDPATWVYYAWGEAEYNENETGDYDKVSIDMTASTGTIYYACRWRLNNGQYVYGGTQGPWNGTTSTNGVLTMVCNMPQPNVPTHQVFCGYTEATELMGEATMEGAGVSWRDASGNWVSGLLYSGTYYASQHLEQCESEPVIVTVEVVDDFPPEVDSPQFFEAESGSLISIYNDVAVNSDGTITWYDNVLDAGNGENPLPIDAMVGEGIYFVTETISGCVSNATPVAIQIGLLGNGKFAEGVFIYYPNPVKDALNLSYSEGITGVEVFNLVGQRVMSMAIGQNEAAVDMAALASGTYVVKVSSGDAAAMIKVVKE